MNIAEQNAHLVETVRRLRAEITRMRHQAEERNALLVALGWVRCTGACPPATPLSEEIVAAAEHNTARMRLKLEALRFQEAQRALRAGRYDQADLTRMVAVLRQRRERVTERRPPGEPAR